MPALRMAAIENDARKHHSMRNATERVPTTAATKHTWYATTAANDCEDGEFAASAAAAAASSEDMIYVSGSASLPLNLGQARQRAEVESPTPHYQRTMPDEVPTSAMQSGRLGAVVSTANVQATTPAGHLPQNSKSVCCVSCAR